VGGVELLGSLLSAKPVKEVDTGPTWVPRAAPEPSTLVRDAALQRLSAPFGLGRSLLQAGRDPRGSYEHAVDTVRGLAEAGALAARPASETPLNQPVGPHRRFDWLAIDLDAVKRVGKRLGGTVNDVALATAAGAIGRFLELRGITPAEQAELDFRVSCPVNTRTDRDRGRAGNRVSNLVAPLPIAERDPVERLARVRSTMRELKDSRQTLAFGVVESLSEQVAPGLLTLFARQNLENRSSNIVFTNVPGPPSRWHLLESQLQEVYPVVPLMPGQALGIALMSYSGGLYWGFNSDWELVPDLHELVVATHAAFEELCAAAEKAPARPRRSSKRRRSDASGASP
jgi:WS/DGAT/MGAT family acyltransferase